MMCVDVNKGIGTKKTDESVITTEPYGKGFRECWQEKLQRKQAEEMVGAKGMDRGMLGHTQGAESAV